MSFDPATYIKDKFQEFIDDWTKGVQDLADSVFGENNDNADKPVFVTNTFHVIGVVLTQARYTNPSIYYQTFQRSYLIDVNMNQGVLKTAVDPFYRFEKNIEWQHVSDDYANQVDANMDNIMTTNFDIYQAHDGELLCYYSNTDAVFTVRYGNPPSNHDTDVYTKLTGDNGTIRKSNSMSFSLSSIGYTVSNDGLYASFTPYNPSDTRANLMICLKTFPAILTCDNNTFINNYISRNGATHNYHHTYTTGGGDTVDLYYGDNYVIINNNGNDTSYNDVKNMLDIAVTKINDDNDTDYTVPTYNENKYGDNMDKNHEIDMPVSKFSEASGMVYYYQLEPDDVWKVRDGLNTINLDPLVLKDVTRNLISYKLFALDKTALMDEHTPVIVHIGGREIKYNDASIPAEYIKTVKNINLGAITINRIYHDYRDYAPYVKIELFVPFCGWTSLPSWCMDTTITGTMFIDLMNGSCKAVIKANSTVVCEIGGVCAYDVPFVADATGSKASSLLSKVATTAGAVASGNPLAIATTGISLSTAMNENYTRMMGVCGDGSNINGLDRMYVKITRVSWTNPFQIERPDIYKHTYGIPCGKSLTLTEGDGYTQIMDANITGAMTDREKQMIIDGFRHGLIL